MRLKHFYVKVDIIYGLSELWDYLLSDRAEFT